MSAIEGNLKLIQEKIALARSRSKHQQNVCLISVTKTHSTEVLQEAYGYGLRVFGENRVQELLAKKPCLPEDINWHLIGPLQTNKVKAILPHVKLIHSLDRPSLADELDKRAGEKEITAAALIEVNVAKENTKHGILPEEVSDFVQYAASKKHLHILGLMTVAPVAVNPEEIRWVFHALRMLFMDIKKLSLANVNMQWLSMGMTNDFEIAIEEGANMVRIGSGIFGAR